MDPKVWGPNAWIFLHSITMNYPKNPTNEDKEKYRTFFYSLGDILPCPQCKEHYQRNLIDYPIDLRNKEGLVKWLIKIHNNVNEINGKPILSYDDVIDNYQELYYRSPYEKTLHIIFIIIIIILLVIYFLK